MTQPFGPPEPEPKFDHLLEQPPILEVRLRSIETYVIALSRKVARLEAQAAADPREQGRT